MHAPGDLVLLEEEIALNDRWNRHPALVIHAGEEGYTLLDGTGATWEVETRIVHTFFMLLSKAT